MNAAFSRLAERVVALPALSLAGLGALYGFTVDGAWSRLLGVAPWLAVVALSLLFHLAMETQDRRMHPTTPPWWSLGMTLLVWVLWPAVLFLRLEPDATAGVCTVLVAVASGRGYFIGWRLQRDAVVVFSHYRMQLEGPDLVARQGQIPPGEMSFSKYVRAWWGGHALERWVREQTWADEVLWHVSLTSSEADLLDGLLTYLEARGYLPELCAESERRHPELMPRVRWPGAGRQPGSPIAPPPAP